MGQFTANETINECYLLREPSGRDAFAESWKASAIFSASQFLIRFLSPGLSEAALSAEKKLVLSAYDLSHPALVGVLEADLIRGRMALVNEFGGESLLSSALGAGASYARGDSFRIAIEICRALEALRARGIVFGTLDPGSILVSPDRGAVNAVRLVAPGYLPLLSSGVKPDDAVAPDFRAYLAPEVRGLSAHPVDARADVYSVGILLFRLVTGSLPFSASSRGEEDEKAASLRFAASALEKQGVPPGLSATIVACFHRNPADRPSGPAGLARELLACVDEPEPSRTKPAPLNARDEESKDRIAYFMSLSPERPAPNPGPAPKPRTSRQIDYLYPVDEKVDEPAVMPFKAEPVTARHADMRDANSPRDANSREPAPAIPGPLIVSDNGKTKPDTAGNGAADRAKAVSELAGNPIEPQGGGRADASIETGSRAGPERKRRSARTSTLWRIEIMDARELIGSFIDAAKKGEEGFFRFVEATPSVREFAAKELDLKRLGKRVLAVDARRSVHDAKALARALKEAFEPAVAQLRGKDGAEAAEAAAAAIRLLERAHRTSAAKKVDAPKPARAKWKEAAAALAAIATPSRPLLLVIRLSGKADEGLRAYLSALAELTDARPLCVLVYYDGPPPVRTASRRKTLHESPMAASGEDVQGSSHEH
jgi:eukaryotic-like serine/threonine-protein kinase